MNRPAIARLVSLCSTHCRPANLTGPGNRPARIAIIEAITGTRPKPHQAGINRMMYELYTAFPVPAYTCQANKESQLEILIKQAAPVDV